jgi:transcriptional regulator with XRE-family HTH domain
MKKSEDTILTALKQLMSENNLRQVDLVRDSGLSKSSLSMMLSGARNPEIDSLRKICSAMNISLSSFFLRVAQLEQNSTAHEFDFKGAFEKLAELDDLIMGGNNDDDDDPDIQEDSPVTAGSVAEMTSEVY